MTVILHMLLMIHNIKPPASLNLSFLPHTHFDLYGLHPMNVNNCTVGPGQIYALIKPSVPYSNVIEI